MTFTTIDLERLESLRRDHSNAQATLRDSEYALDQLKVRATDDIVTALGAGDREAGWKALGANEAARTHRLNLELACHDTLQTQARLVRQTRAKVDALDAEIHALTDRRRLSEWEARDRIVAALLTCPALAGVLAGEEVRAS